ncbi:MAG: hypothetical protein ACYCST_19785 [Acidimicrobiales bacterium]
MSRCSERAPKTMCASTSTSTSSSTSSTRWSFLRPSAEHGSTGSVAVDHLVPVLEAAIQDAGLRVERVLDNPGFTRLVVMSDGDRTELDLGSDARILPVDQGPGFPMLSGEELAVDKVLAVFGRAESSRWQLANTRAGKTVGGSDGGLAAASWATPQMAR